MKTAKVLVVDDERALVDILSRVLPHEGHAVVGVSSAEEAIAALAAGAFDLILLDQVLPGTTGMQCLGILRALTDAPIHLMSGYSDDSTLRDAKLLGASGFLQKPFELTEIFSLLESLPERAK